MSEHSYSFPSRVIHHLALSSKAVGEASFDIERAIYRVRGNDIGHQPHVFVTGLARAGTTILMRLLYRTGAYRSLTYRDMPFVLAPNLWSGIRKMSPKDMTAEERAHGDGILIDFDSPEALEEVFWRVTCGNDYIREDRLVPMSADRDAENDFRDYIALLLRQHPGKRYLSKNNNNILRLSSLVRCFPNATVVIPFREPLQHAYSLMRQHRNFLERHRRDRFSRKYMTWLAHHEFGQDHRPFVFDEKTIGHAARHGCPETDLGYWLQLWIDVYGFIYATAPEPCILLSYERLCSQTETVWSGLCSKLSLPKQPAAELLHLSHRAIDQDLPDELLHKAHALYDALSGRSA